MPKAIVFDVGLYPLSSGKTGFSLAVCPPSHCFDKCIDSPQHEIAGNRPSFQSRASVTNTYAPGNQIKRRRNKRCDSCN
jgi:hypothetical protein